jgi:hypothetical protein
LTTVAVDLESLVSTLLSKAFGFSASAMNPGREKAHFSSSDRNNFHGINYGAKEKQQA